MTDEGRRLTARSSSSWPPSTSQGSACVLRGPIRHAGGQPQGNHRRWRSRPAAHGGRHSRLPAYPLSPALEAWQPQHVRHCVPRRTMDVSGPWGFSRPSESLNRLHLRLPPAPRPRHMAARHTTLFHRATAHRSSHPEFSFEKIASTQSCFSDLDSRHGSDPVCRQALV